MKQSDDDRARLRFHLDLQDGFWFALVAADDPVARDALRDEVRGWASERGIAFHALGPEPDAVLDALGDGLAWVIASGPASVAEEAVGRLLLALNERREALRRHHRGGLVIEGPARSKVLLRNLAPDLFSIRACIVEPAGPSPEVHREAPWWLGEGLVDRAQVREWGQPGLPWSRWAMPLEGAPDEARAALAEARRLEGREGDGARRSRFSALSRAMEALLAQGWVTEAAPVAERMAELAEGLPAGGGSAAGMVTAPDTWARAMIAEAREGRAVIAHAQGDLEGARELWRQALTVRLELAGPLDASTAPRHADLARAWGHLGELALQAGDPAEASTALHAARSVREELAAAFPRHAEWQADLALSFSLLGDLALEQGDADGARAAFDRAVAIRRDLVESHPDDPRLGAVLAFALGRRSLAASIRGEEARADAQEARDRLVTAVASDPGNVTWQAWLAMAWSRLGDAARSGGDLDQAGRCWDEALAIRRALCDDDPENARWHRTLAVVLDRLAELALLQGRVDRARELADEALDVAEQLGWQEPSNADFQLGLARARLVASEVAAARGDAGAAGRMLDLARDAHAHVLTLGARGWRVDRLGERLRERPP